MSEFMSSAHCPSFPSLHLRHNSFSKPSVALPTSQFILQPFSCFTYITVHELCSFSILSVTSTTSQLILQPFRRFTYITVHSPILPLLHLRHRLLTYVTWRAAHAHCVHRFMYIWLLYVTILLLYRGSTSGVLYQVNTWLDRNIH